MWDNDKILSPLGKYVSQFEKSAILKKNMSHLKSELHLKKMCRSLKNVSQLEK